MGEKEEIEKIKKLMSERGIDFDEYVEAKKAHVERLKRLDKQLLASRRKLKIHFIKEGK
jgi:hypothetical protein